VILSYKEMTLDAILAPRLINVLALSPGARIDRPLQ
jgi:hypothetical protein